MKFQTPLHIAASSGYEEVVRLLLDHGADMDIKNVTTSLTFYFFKKVKLLF
jgi:ankyrin repeat protein